MTQTTTARPGTTWSRVTRLAFWVLVALTGALGVLHLVGVVLIADGDDERLMFACFAALNALSLVVILGPFRRGEPWAWSASWIQVAANAAVLPTLGTEGPGPQYLAFALVMTACMLLTRPNPGS